MSRKCRKIAKYDLEGNQVGLYPSITAAAAANNKSANSIYHFAYTGHISEGFKYAFEGEKVTEYGHEETPWEVDGMFSIDGWADAFIY